MKQLARIVTKEESSQTMRRLNQKFFFLANYPYIRHLPTIIGNFIVGRSIRTLHHQYTQRIEYISARYGYH